MSTDAVSLAQELTEARTTVARQAAELASLRAAQDEDGFAAMLRDLLIATGAAAVLAAPADAGDLLTAIVATAAEVLQATAGSLFLVDEEREELVFQVALGAKAEAVRQFRLPLGQGIAGYVAVTGQPLAIADAASDPRLAREIGQAIDYVPRTLLCVPLVVADRVVGVLQLLDKAGGTPFTMADLGALGHFGSLAAQAIEQARLTSVLRLLFRTLLVEIAGGESFEPAAERFATLAATAGEHGETVKLAGLVHDLSRQGERERRLAVEVLTSLARFTASPRA